MLSPWEHEVHAAEGNSLTTLLTRVPFPEMMKAAWVEELGLILLFASKAVGLEIFRAIVNHSFEKKRTNTKKIQDNI